jgi:abortive infection Abi-like protein
MNLVNGIGTLRNRLSDSHGRGGKPVRPSPRHASLAVNLAGGVATFLVETFLAQEEGKSAQSGFASAVRGSVGLWEQYISADVDMRFQITFNVVERLRRESIGNPQLMPKTRTYEYAEQSARVVAVLKLVRAAHGVAALEVLRLNGLFIDLGMVMRGVYDSVEEVYFLLEEYPNTSRHVDQFVTAFFEGNIDGYLSASTNDVLKKHIRSARVRCLKGAHDQATQDLLERLFKSFSGYVHAKYAHVMEVYGGGTGFNLSGVPSSAERLKRAEPVVVQANSVIHAALFAAQKFGLLDLERDIQSIVRENFQ